MGMLCAPHKELPTPLDLKAVLQSDGWQCLPRKGDKTCSW